MKGSQRRGSLGPLDSMSLARRYFASVKTMDQAGLRTPKTRRKGRDGVDSIMRLWADGGELTLTGPAPIGKHTFRGHRELQQFYRRRGRGVHAHLDANFSRVQVANAKSAERLTVSGMRYVVNARGEGMQVPFTHNFQIEDGKIQALRIAVGKPKRSDVAPVGTLKIDDMGRLAAMAWMVA